MKKIIIFTDGGARGNPGPAGAGAVICNEKGEKMKEYGKYLGDNLTNNEAEYMAAIFGLEKFKASFGKRLAKEAELTLCVDSELLAKQMQGKYKVKDAWLQKLQFIASRLVSGYNKVVFTHIPRAENKEADRVAGKYIENSPSQLF